MNDTFTLLSFLLGQNNILVKKKVRVNCHNFDTIFTGFSTEISNSNLITIEDFRHEFEPIWKSSRVRPSSLFEEK